MIDTGPELPSRFGSFYLYDFIGRGGMAEIFLAKTFTKLGTDRDCVIKRILPHLNQDKEFCEMLIREAKLCARLSHANVVQTFDLGHIHHQYYIAMEYVEGFDLNQLLGLLARARISLSLQFGLYIITRALRGLDYAHRITDADGTPLGIIHRDVSPTNILISTDGDVKMCDFGIAKATFDALDSGQLDEYHLKGKVAYMAPEHLTGETADLRADLYGVGILLWELLSGRRLFKRKDEAETLKLAKACEVPPLSNRELPQYEALNAIVMRALAKDPNIRFTSGQAFINALEDYMQLAELMVSQLKFADFLTEHFGEELMEQRRARERQLAALIERQDELQAMNSIAPPPAKSKSDKPKKERTSRDTDNANLIRAVFSEEESGEFDEPLDLVNVTRPSRPPPKRGAKRRFDSAPHLRNRENNRRGPPYQWIAAFGVILAAAAVIYYLFF